MISNIKRHLSQPAPYPTQTKGRVLLVMGLFGLTFVFIYFLPCWNVLCSLGFPHQKQRHLWRVGLAHDFPKPMEAPHSIRYLRNGNLLCFVQKVGLAILHRKVTTFTTSIGLWDVGNCATSSLFWAFVQWSVFGWLFWLLAVGGVHRNIPHRKPELASFMVSALSPCFFTYTFARFSVLKKASR